MDKIKFLACQIPFFFTFGASAYLVDGSMLLSDYEKRKPAAVGYIEGVSDMGNRSVFCIPAGTGTSQLKKLALDYLTTTENIKKPAAHLVSNAFREAFPCSENATPQVEYTALPEA